MNRQIKTQNNKTGYMFSICLYPVTKLLKQASLLLKVNNKAPTAIAKFIKNDPIMKFIMKTNNAKAAIGAEQQIMKQIDCNIGLIYQNKYILAPKRFALTVIINGPIHIPMKRLVKAYYALPSVLKAQRLAVKRVIQRGPHMSHYFLIFSQSPYPDIVTFILSSTLLRSLFYDDDKQEYDGINDWLIEGIKLTVLWRTAETLEL